MNARDAALLLGIAIDRKPLDQLLDDALAAITRRGQRVIFACANPHSLVTAQNDPMFLRALNRASHVVADGIGVTMMVRLLGMNRGERITGHDFFMRMMQALEQRGGGRVFFFGSSQQVQKMIYTRCARDFTRVTVCGMVSPPYRAWSVVDFYAGTFPRAPAWMCRFGIEWLYRLSKEPQRMWRRNFVSSPLFVLLVLRRHLLRMRA